MFGGEDSVGCSWSWQSYGAAFTTSRFEDYVAHTVLVSFPAVTPLLWFGTVLSEN